MCGFIGRINRAEEIPSITAALEFLKRRGPDSHAVWSSTDRCVELLHARLAIVDTDARAVQPFTDDRNGVTVAFNGEIYNYRELREEIADYTFRTRSDTEVIIALYVTRGIDGLKLLRGMFALSIVDSNKRRVFLARDSIGKKPLFFANWECGVYFGSSVLALVAASGEEAELNTEQFEQFWSDGHTAPTSSVIKNCSAVSPGSVLELDWDGNVLAVHQCTPELSHEPGTDVDAVRERIGELIKQSLKRRLSNNPNPVCLLSGGVDSTVVASRMKEVIGGSAITLGSFVPGTNDERYARFAAKRLELPLQVVRARSNDLATDVSWSMDLQDEPLGMISFFPLAMMIRAARDYGKILLTGDGGDEVFLGYGSPAEWIATEAHRATDSNVSIPNWMSDWGRQMVTTSLLGHMFTKLDRASAELGVETRCPLLDVELVSYVRTLDPAVLFFEGRTKALLKNQLSNWPSAFVNRRKMGFTYNLRWAWVTNRFAGLREMVSSEAVETFASHLPAELKLRPTDWTLLSIFRNFADVWKLIAWSRFLERLRLASSHSRTAERADRAFELAGVVAAQPIP